MRLWQILAAYSIWWASLSHAQRRPGPPAAWKPGAYLYYGPKTGQLTVGVRYQGYVNRSSAKTLFAVVRDRDREVQRKSVFDEAFQSDGGVALLNLPLPSIPGEYQIDIEESGTVKESLHASVAEVACWGGEKKTSYCYDASAIWFAPSKVNALKIRHWAAHDADPSYRIEWLRDGKSSFVEEGRAHQLNKILWLAELMHSPVEAKRQCAWTCAEESFQPPPSLLDQPGEWEVRVYREKQPARSYHFRVLSGRKLDNAGSQTVPLGLGTALITPPAIAHKLSMVPASERVRPGGPGLKNPVEATAGEVRALARSAALLEERLAFNKLAMPPVTGNWMTASPTQQQTMSPDQVWQYERKINAEASARTARVNAADRAKALGLAPSLRAHIEKLSQPWRDDELPH